jgi:metal-responsive CopG/Arc/MetJ family transcriptional regulator
MATHPIGKGSKTIGINMPEKMAHELEARAASMHISKSKYVKIILRQWVESGKKLTLSEKK